MDTKSEIRQLLRRAEKEGFEVIWTARHYPSDPRSLDALYVVEKLQRELFWHRRTLLND